MIKLLTFGENLDLTEICYRLRECFDFNCDYCGADRNAQSPISEFWHRSSGHKLITYHDYYFLNNGFKIKICNDCESKDVVNNDIKKIRSGLTITELLLFGDGPVFDLIITDVKREILRQYVLCA